MDTTSNNRLGGDYPDPAFSRPFDGGPRDYGIKRAVDPRGLHDLDNVHSPTGATPPGGCGLSPIQI